MPTTSIQEHIEVAVETRLNAISVATGYNYDYRNNGTGKDLRKLKNPNDVNEFPVLFCPPGSEQPKMEGTAGTVQVSKTERVLNVEVWAYHKSSAHGTQMNKIRQDVERALFADSSTILGLTSGGVTAIEVGTIEKDQDVADENLEFVRMIFPVTFRYGRGNP